MNMVLFNWLTNFDTHALVNNAGKHNNGTEEIMKNLSKDTVIDCIEQQFIALSCNNTQLSLIILFSSLCLDSGMYFGH